MPTPSQQRTAKARQVFAEKFSDPETKSAHFAELAQRSHANRLTLNRDEREALGTAYELLGRIAARHNLNDPDEPEAA